MGSDAIKAFVLFDAEDADEEKKGKAETPEGDSKKDEKQREGEGG